MPTNFCTAGVYGIVFPPIGHTIDGVQANAISLLTFDKQIMEAFKGIFNDAGDLFDTIKDKIASPAPKSDQASDDHTVTDAIKKITFSDMNSVSSSADSRGDLNTHLVTDVLIIGAGLAGLTTAYMLLQKNSDLKINIVEASDRVGGRLLTKEVRTAGSGKDLFDLGGEWLNRKQKRIINLVSELGLETYEQDYGGAKVLIPAEGKPVSFQDHCYPIGVVGRYDLNSFVARLEVLKDMVPFDDPTKCLDALEWDAITLEQFKKSHTWTTGGRQLFDALVVLNLGVTPREISLLFFLYILKTHGGWSNMCNIGKGSGRQLKIKGGAERLCGILADRIGREKIILSDPVTEINQDDDERCQIRTRNGRVFWARRAVTTIPPKCISQITFRPKLPLGKEAIINHSFAGKCLKFVVTFDTVFWRNDVISKNGVVLQLVDQQKELEKLKIYGEGDIMGYTFVFDATTVNSMPALTGYAFSRKLRDSYEPSEREDVILKTLHEVFGDQVYSRIDYIDKIWGDKDYEADLPCTVISPGVFAFNYMMIQRPVMRLHWAGTETSTSWYGQMEGAVESAERASSEVIYYLNRSEGEDIAVYTDTDEVRERKSSTVDGEDEEDSLSTNTV